MFPEPVPGNKEAPIFREAERRAANAEAAPFVTLMTCAQASLAEGATLTIARDDDFAALSLFQRIMGFPQQSDRAVRASLERLSVGGQVLCGAYLSDADLRGADLTGVLAKGARLSDGTNLRGATDVPQEWRNHPSLREDDD
jgi:hypothetical protein